jgi:hypothetical protein
VPTIITCESERLTKPNNAVKQRAPTFRWGALIQYSQRYSFELRIDPSLKCTAVTEDGTRTHQRRAASLSGVDEKTIDPSKCSVNQSD